MQLHLNWLSSRSAVWQHNTESADWPRLGKTLCPAIGFHFSLQFSVSFIFGFFLLLFTFTSVPEKKTPFDQIFPLRFPPMPSLLWLAALLPLTLALFALLLIISQIKFMVHKPEISIQMHEGQGGGAGENERFLNKLQAHFVAPRCRLIVCRGSSEKVSEK